MRSLEVLRTVAQGAQAGVASQDYDLQPPSWAMYGIIYLNLTATAGTTPTFDLKLQWADPLDPTVKEDFPGAGITQLTGADFVIFMVGAPALADDDTGPVYSTAVPLPPQLNINIAQNTGDETYTYSLCVVWVG